MNSKYQKYLEMGDRFGRLSIIGVDGDFMIQKTLFQTPSTWKYLCKCTCGNIISVYRLNLLRGVTRSCGCLSKETTIARCSKINEIEVIGSKTKIFLSNKSDKCTIIDTEDYDKIKNFCWREHNGYVVTNLKNKKGSGKLHRMILNAPKDKIIDHKNRNKLDNRKENLRFCDKSENGRNTNLSKRNKSGVKGVYYTSKAWRAEIYHKGKKVHLGRFERFECACQARWDAEKIYQKEFRSTAYKENQ